MSGLALTIISVLVLIIWTLVGFIYSMVTILSTGRHKSRVREVAEFALTLPFACVCYLIRR